MKRLAFAPPPLQRLRAAAAACFAGLPLAAGATPDFAVPAVVCVPGNTQTMNAENKPLSAGVARQAGRNTPPRMYFCPVFNPDVAASQPSWGTLRLTYADNTPAKGNVVVRLFAKSRAKVPTDPPLGATFSIAQVASLPAVGTSVVSAPLTAQMDFHRYTYWFVLEMSSPTGINSPQVDVHELQLTD
jgi:hypothetical protein